jgi:hypothetical protein
MYFKLCWVCNLLSFPVALVVWILELEGITQIVDGFSNFINSSLGFANANDIQQTMPHLHKKLNKENETVKMWISGLRKCLFYFVVGETMHFAD